MFRHPAEIVSSSLQSPPGFLRHLNPGEELAGHVQHIATTFSEAIKAKDNIDRFVYYQDGVQNILDACQQHLGPSINPSLALRHHSKRQSQPFVSDSQKKRESFSADSLALIQDTLQPLYQELLGLKG